MRVTNKVAVCFLLFTFLVSSLNPTIRAQDSSINPDKVKALSEEALPQDKQDEIIFGTSGDNLVPTRFSRQIRMFRLPTTAIPARAEPAE